jgi:hypothetical protein
MVNMHRLTADTVRAETEVYTSPGILCASFLGLPFLESLDEVSNASMAPVAIPLAENGAILESK